MSARVPSIRTIALVSALASACSGNATRSERAASTARAARATDASVRVNTESPSMAARFESRDGELRAQVASHSVVAREAETRIEGSHGHLLTLGATRMIRGRSALGTAGRPERHATGRLERAVSASVTERVVTTPLGTEQTWRFAARPSGSDALVVRVPVTSGRYLGSDARGLRFASAGGEVVYSHATFVDADGARTPVAATFVEGAIVLEVDAGTLDTARYPAVLDPTISPIVTITPATAGSSFPAFGDQRFSSFARFSDALGLVAYVDVADPNGATLDAMRVDSTGTRVGSVFRIASGVSVEKTEMTCNASDCLVVFMTSGKLVTARVDASGAVLDSVPDVIASVGSLRSLAVDDDGATRTIVWSDVGTPGGTNSNIDVAYVAADGSVIAPGPSVLATATGASEVTVASLGGTTLVAWDEKVGTEGRIRGLRVDAAHLPLDATPVTLRDLAGIQESLPRLARRATDLVLVYRGYSYLEAMSVALLPTFTVSTSVSLHYATPAPSVLAVTVNGTNTEIAQANPDTPYSTDMVRSVYSQTFAFVDYRTLLSRGSGSDSIDIAPMSGGRVVVAATKHEVTYVAGLDSNGYDVAAASTNTDVHNITLGGASARSPDAALAGATFAVSTIEDAASVGTRVAVTRMTGSGAALDSPPAVVANGIFTTQNHSHFTTAAVANLGTQFFLAWYRPYLDSVYSPQSFVECATVDEGGAPNVGVLRSIANAREPLDLLGGATTATLTYSDTSYARYVSITSSTIGGAGYYASLYNIPSVRADGTLGVGWSATTFGVLRPGGVATSIASASADDGGPGASEGARSVLVVRRNAIGGVATTVEAMLMNLASTAITKGPFVVSSGASLVGPPRVAFDGTYFDVFFARGSTLSMARVDEDGVVRDPVASTVATGVSRERAPAVAANRTGKVLVAYETFDPSAGVRAARVAAQLIDWNGAGTGAANGSACNSVLQCASGNCVDGVCCNTTCGFGATDDCQACSAAASGTAPDGTCGATTSAVVCRASAGVCDAAESCTGSSTTCPGDLKVAVGTVCGAASTQPCETAQLCNGVSNACQPKAPAQGSPVCRPASDLCDAVEYCNGVSTVCPIDSYATAAVTCRPASDLCDQADHCSGLSAACPPDLVQPAAAVCRAANGPCDQAEFCDGAGKGCPTDQPAFIDTVCRNATLPCDVPEICDGVSFTCPADGARPSGYPCRDPISPCDALDVCDGTQVGCPADGFAPATQVCRSIAGPCDLPEYCTGAGTACPIDDSKKPAGTVCRASAGICDVAEVCTGASSACPTETFRPQATVCRPADGLCDSAETCSGRSAACPGDRQRIDGSACGDGLVCNGHETCQAGECIEGEALVCAEASPCNESTGACAPRTRPRGAAGCAVGLAHASGANGASVWVAFAVGLVLLRRRRGPSCLRSLAPMALVAIALFAQGCVCGVGAASCDGACVDVGYDESNCGACGVSCGRGQCIEGACVGNPTTGRGCSADAECIDGDVCDGVERCVGGRCRDGEVLSCDDGLACTTDRCESTVGSCIAVPNTGSCGVSP